MRSTGQVGPRITDPRTPELAGVVVVGQGVNSQFGPVRPTAEPSGQIFASIVQAFPPPGIVVGGELVEVVEFVVVEIFIPDGATETVGTPARTC